MENKFKERLQQLRAERNISRRALSKATHICEKTLKSWEEGKTKPKITHFIILVDYFNVTCNYLLGLPDKKTDH